MSFCFSSPSRTFRFAPVLLLALLALPAAVAQTAAPAANSAANASKDSTVTLSPFEVREDKDSGYQAQNTLSGTRLNSSLANIPAAIQVLTKELILDLNLVDYEGYLN